MCLLLWLVLPLLADGSKTLRVCADPNNLPFSNQQEQGFENRLAHMVGDAMGVRVEFVWWSARKGLVRSTLNAGECDVLMGVPSTFDSAGVTQPYYRSSYVFVTRQDRALHVVSLNDGRLGKWRIGMHMIGEGYTPPALALAERGITANVVGYRVFGALGERDPQARLIEAVAKGEIDVAIVWGPVAGYFARAQGVRLEITPVTPESFQEVPFQYAISMAVRRGDDGLRTALDGILRSKCTEVRTLLKGYGVPVVSGEGGTPCDGSRQSLASWR